MKNKILISVLIVWTFLNIFLLILNFSTIKSGGFDINGRIYYSTDNFYPITYVYKLDENSSYDRVLKSELFILKYYDFSEFFIYVGGVWLIYFLIKYIKK
jgi:hypothetical protein